MKRRISIEGMSCMHCVKHVEEALKEISAVNEVTVCLQGKNAVVDLSGEVSDATLKAAIEDAGYDVVGIQNL